jgi:hypothetical protein
LTTDVLATRDDGAEHFCLRGAGGASLAPRLTEVAGLFFVRPQPLVGLVQEHVMAKEQRRGNREIRKPKKKKEPVTAPVVVVKGASASTGAAKKKN